MKKLLIFASLLVLLVGLFLWNREPAAFLEASALFNKGQVAEAKKILDQAQNTLPADRFHLYKAYIERSQNALDTANQDLAKALSSSPNPKVREEILINQALTAFLQKDPETVQSILAALQQEAPRHAWINYLTSLLTTLKKNTPQAFETLQQTPLPPPLSAWMEVGVKGALKPVWFQIQKARVELSGGHFVQARQLLEEAQKSASAKELDEIHFLLGMSYLKEAEEKPLTASLPFLKLAFSYFEQVPWQAPDYQNERKELLQKLRVWFDKYSDQKENVLVFEEFYRDLHAEQELPPPKMPPEIPFSDLEWISMKNMYAQLSNQFLLEEDFSGAQAAIASMLLQIEKQIQLFPDSLELYLEKIRALIDLALALHTGPPQPPLKQIPQLRTAYALSREIAAQAPKVAQVYFLEGLAAYLLSENTTALESFQKALALDPALIEAYKFQGLAFFQDKKSDLAIASLNKAVQLAPKDGDAWQVLGDIYVAQGNGLDGATALETALQLKPADYRIYIKLAELKLNLENLSEAKELLETALKLSPNNIQALELLLKVLSNPLLEQNAQNPAELEQEQTEVLERLRVQRAQHGSP
jgi:tetratricopeptide (TPR) repeat protein